MSLKNLLVLAIPVALASCGLDSIGPNLGEAGKHIGDGIARGGEGVGRDITGHDKVYNHGYEAGKKEAELRQAVEDSKKSKPSQSKTYEVTFWTGKRDHAGTSAKVDLTAYGTKGTERFSFDGSGKPFTAGNTDPFTVTASKDLGQINKIMVVSDGGGGHGGWYLIKVRIVETGAAGTAYDFKFNRWFSKTQGLSGEAARL